MGKRVSVKITLCISVLLAAENDDRLPLLTLDVFFEGNTAEDSIAPNDCDSGCPTIAEIWELIRNLEKRPDIAWIRIELPEGFCCFAIVWD